MARHTNQRALTVNTKRINPNPQPAAPKPAAPARNKGLEIDEIDFDAPSHLDLGFHLILTGQSRAGGGW